jgi:Uma2 family endonuclease
MSALIPTMSAGPVTYASSASLARFSVDDYQKMTELGILTPDDKVELLENYVVLKMSRNPIHDGTIQLIQENLAPWIPRQWRLRVQLTVVLADSQPEPDFSIVRGDARSFLTHRPGPSDVGILIEVAESSLLRDQQDKTRIYARANITTYWIVNLVDRRIEVYTQPSGPTADPTYGPFQAYAPGDAIPLVLDGVTVATIPVADLLP